VKLASTALIFALASCKQVGAEVIIPLSVFSVETHRAKDVLIRVVRYNIDKSELRLESIRPIQHELLDFVDIKSFTVTSGDYVFEKCDELLISPVKVEKESVQMEFECFLPRGGAVVAACTVPIYGTKFGKMVCERKEE
jgi:hypothetical protein